MKLNNIKSFSVYGLFGTSDVHIPFDNDVKILIGENGLGKTQLLNIFYYTLTRNFEKLLDYPFEKVVLEFTDGQIKFSKKEIEAAGYETLSKKEKYYHLILNDPNRDKEEKRFIKRRLMNFRREKDFTKRKKSHSLRCEKKIKEYTSNYSILYFPTFRRVEEDLHNLGYSEDEVRIDKKDTRLIHFGMDDVQSKFNSIEDEIDALLKEGFSKITGEILSQLVKGFSQFDQSILDRIDEKDIEIILSRVGNQLSENDKEQIRNIVLKKEIKNPSLLYFLQKLIQIYERQKPLDNFIKVYRDVCNKYLINKKLFYDESNIKIYIKPDGSDQPIPLNKLSSGEKQILSIFSKIYLSDDDEKFMVLFDEPELSLSVTWQEKLLPDILNSKKCAFLLAVTHSPFIFDNELDKYAVGLNEYFQPSNTLVTAH